MRITSTFKPESVYNSCLTGPTVLYLFSSGTVSAIDSDGTTDNEEIIYTVMNIPDEFSYSITAAAVQLSTNTSFSTSASVIIF